MKRRNQVLLGLAAAAALAVGGSVPAQAAGSQGGFCGGTPTSCVLTIKTHTTAGNVTIEWHNTNATSTLKVTLFGPYNYECTLESTGVSQSKVCPSVPAGEMRLTMYKPSNKYAYYGASW